MKVTIENHDGRLRLRWRHQGKRYTLGCGVPDTPTGKALAKQKAAQIELDVSAGYFDSTLMKYRPKILGKNASEITTVELFERFSQYKKKDCGISARSIEARYKPLTKYLERSLNLPAHEVTVNRALNFKAILVENLTAQTAKERLWLLQSCWEWATGKYNVAKENPWIGLASGTRGQSPQRTKPFTTAEITAILEAFRTHRYYSHYFDYVSFLFNAATRPGEAAGLKWDAVSSDFRTVWVGKSYSRGNFGTTKTGKARTIILNATTSEMLRKRFEAVSPQPDDWVFTTKRGLPICDRNFRNRAWVSILAECHIPYRKPYTTRKSAISHALKNKANYLEVAESAGHDPKVMHDHYAHAIQSQSVFVEF